MHNISNIDDTRYTTNTITTRLYYLGQTLFLFQNMKLNYLKILLAIINTMYKCLGKSQKYITMINNHTIIINQSIQSWIVGYSFMSTWHESNLFTDLDQLNLWTTFRLWIVHFRARLIFPIKRLTPIAQKIQKNDAFEWIWCQSLL